MCALLLIVGAVGLQVAAVEAAATPRAADESESESASSEGSSEATFGDEASAQPTSSPTTTPTPQPSPTATGSPAPSQTPTSSGSSPSPTETSSPSPPGLVNLVVGSRARALLVQLGSQVNYVVTVENTGDVALDGVTVINDVPSELDVAGVPVIDEADSINLISVGSREQIVWGFNRIEPGTSLRLPWTAVVVGVGDFSATNNVTAVSPSKVAEGASDIFLAVPGRARVDDTPVTEAPPRTVTRKVVTYVQRRVVTAPETASAEGLPATGVAATGWFWLGTFLLGAGAFLVLLLRARSDQRRTLLLAMAAVMTFAACVSNGTDAPSGSQPEVTEDAASPDTTTDDGSGVGAEVGEDEDEGEQVLGTRVGRDDDETVVPEDDDTIIATDPGDDETEVTFETVPVVSFEPVTISGQPLRIESLGSLSGQNSVSFEWDEGSRQILSATSGIRFTDDPATLVANLGVTRGPIGTIAVLTNATEDRRLEVSGRVVLNISGGGSSTNLASEAIDVILEPGGQVTVPFSYLLPSGSYSVVASFEPN
ncbi:MAG: hypothetical protein M3238_05025 [Actinomycetota bacterium]|nr:hypothetical protein [Actinomycetota bacterium]